MKPSLIFLPAHVPGSFNTCVTSDSLLTSLISGLDLAREKCGVTGFFASNVPLSFSFSFPLWALVVVGRGDCGVTVFGVLSTCCNDGIRLMPVLRSTSVAAETNPETGSMVGTLSLNGASVSSWYFTKLGLECHWKLSTSHRPRKCGNFIWRCWRFKTTCWMLFGPAFVSVWRWRRRSP